MRSIGDAQTLGTDCSAELPRWFWVMLGGSLLGVPWVIQLWGVLSISSGAARRTRSQFRRGNEEMMAINNQSKHSRQESAITSQGAALSDASL